MKLGKLLSPWIEKKLPDLEITSIENDSRQIKPGSLFLAYPGFATDGRNFIEQAIKNGAVAVVYEPTALRISTDCCLIPLAGLVTQIADLASRFYNKPASNAAVTGITGTNGKTTIAYQLAQAHSLLLSPSTYIGTLGEGNPANLKPLANTTPDALLLRKLFYQYRQDNIEQICMEVSSHALVQGRVASIDFKQAIFSNLTLDHLDFHKTMQAYAEAKASLFAAPGLEYAIINHDDAYANQIASAVKKPCKIYRYGLLEGADVRAIDWKITLTGTEILIHSPWGELTLKSQCLGFFNIYNALAIFTSLMLSGYKLQEVLSVFPLLKPAPGRMEVIAMRPYVLIDYAHTPDALDKVLSTLAAIKEGRILVVFGCGGDRDRSKRPIMGKIAKEKADLAIITSDNPRTEDPEAIMRDIEIGIGDKTHCYKITNREDAIARALHLSQPEDVVVIAGKGHEAYQQIGMTKFPFSDKEVVMRLLGLVFQ